jgi:hypothetical protein
MCLQPSTDTASDNEKRARPFSLPNQSGRAGHLVKIETVVAIVRFTSENTLSPSPALR